MLTGKRTFECQTVSDTLAAVIMREPDWEALPSGTPAPIQSAVRIFGADRGRSYNDSRALELSKGPSEVFETRQLDPVRRVYHPAPLTGCTEAVDV